MSSTSTLSLSALMGQLRSRTPNETEFHQAALEVVESVFPLYKKRQDYQQVSILERITEPDRVISFRVEWEDDAGAVHVNRGYRVQFNNALGPYKGGLRFHPSVNQSVMKFLAFEQIFKNSLTGLPIGGGKGGADFDPRGKSDREVRRFCRSFMTELERYLGPEIDVPAGDIGVGARELGFLTGTYRHLTLRHNGFITGKPPLLGGSPLRPEATGYGVVYFCDEMLTHHGMALEGKRCVISGSGNVALHAADKLFALGAKIIGISDSKGFLHHDNGFSSEHLAFLKELKFERRARLEEFVKVFKEVSYSAEGTVWDIPCDLAFPCATQNEVDETEATTLLKNGLKGIFEGANMPCTPGALSLFHKAGLLIGPAKAANAGGVTVSGFEQSQNAQRLRWEPEEVDRRLQRVMKEIHHHCVAFGTQRGTKTVDYILGANRAGFARVADAMLATGIV